MAFNTVPVIVKMIGMLLPEPVVLPGLSAIEEEKTGLREEYDGLKEEYDLLGRRYNDLVQSQETLLSGHTRETRRLLNELQKTQEDLQLKEDRLLEIERNATQKMRDREQLRIELEQRNQRLIELESVLNSKDSLICYAALHGTHHIVIPFCNYFKNF